MMGERLPSPLAIGLRDGIWGFRSKATPGMAFSALNGPVLRRPRLPGGARAEEKEHGGAKVTSFEYEELLACGRGELFGSGNAQLPLPPMLMFDRISEIAETGGVHGKGVVRAEFDIKPDLWFFGCHFKGDPVMPGCLGLDALWQMTGFFLGWLGLARTRPGARRWRGQAHRSRYCQPRASGSSTASTSNAFSKASSISRVADGWLET